jgi:hypothetical protein
MSTVSENRSALFGTAAPPHIEGQLPLDDAGKRPPVETVLHVHRDKDSNWNLWESDLAPEGASEDAGRNFAYTLYELGVACRVDLDTGDVIVYGVIDKGEVVRLEREIKGN